MKPPKKREVAKIILWITAEILLNLAGVDDLADCGEYVFERHLPTRIAMVV
jgi:hypothetical protein